jgi:outer membrane protein OmpA-like peptidoglycan-associated protein
LLGTARGATMGAMKSLLFALPLVTGCSLVTVQQEPFPPIQITADRPSPPPPRVVLTPSSIQIADKVQFELGSAKLLDVSDSLLDQVAQVMVENPQIELLQVEGHTDSTGGAKRNRELSQQRAESVVVYIVGKGVAKKRLVAKGFGPDKPIADNGTPEGREANRRVEFNIIKQGPKKTVVTDD